jgi:hypothetical protein
MVRRTADRKWFAPIYAAALLAHTLIEIDPQYPEVSAKARWDLLAVKRNSRPKLRRARPRSRTRSGKKAEQAKG